MTPPIPISIWRNKTGSPGHAFPAMPGSARERVRSAEMEIVDVVSPPMADGGRDRDRLN